MLIFRLYEMEPMPKENGKVSWVQQRATDTVRHWSACPVQRSWGTAAGSAWSRGGFGWGLMRQPSKRWNQALHNAATPIGWNKSNWDNIRKNFSLWGQWSSPFQSEFWSYFYWKVWLSRPNLVLGELLDLHWCLLSHEVIKMLEKEVTLLL